MHTNSNSGIKFAIKHKKFTLMKYLFIILSSFLLFSFTSKDVTDDVTNSLKKGNFSELVKVFSEKLSIKILEEEDLLSKSQAQAMIEDFLSKHKFKSYQALHKSALNGEQQFITGLLDTHNGKFRISILVRGSIISQFRIENDNG